ncbi:IK (predicted), partial [Pycnogonum litorale]
ILLLVRASTELENKVDHSQNEFRELDVKVKFYFKMPEIHDSFSNPPPPSGMEATKDKEEHPLTNEDFRKLMMTPRVVSSKQTPSLNHSTKSESIRSESVSSRSENRKQKKTYYAQLKKQEESVLAELAKKYRDRARERRDGGADEGQSVEVDPLVATAGYRAVAPDAKSGIDAAERRRQMIQKSKFLGGDMEHTHLVKGLDYALLQKVRSEITNKESEDVELEETLKTTKSKNDEDEEEKIQFKTRLAKNIYRQVFKIKPPERNENFLPGRMAYIIELDDEFADSDVPTTLMRSKTDCPSMESQTTLTTNDIVINKLTQILSYLRSGM